MSDVFVDRILERGRLKEVWFELTKKMFKNFWFYEVLEWVVQASEERDNIKYKKINRFVKSEARKIIDGRFKISQIAGDYGIKIKGKMMVCPFHEDKDPSLSFDDSKNIFHCFGCGAKGDIIEFIKRLKENGYKKRD